MIFPNGVGAALEQRSAFRGPRAPVSSRRTSPMTWGELEQAFSGTAGHYSSAGLVSRERAYRDSPWIEPTIHAFASALAGRPFRMFREVGDKKDRVLNHWLIDLMARPNPYARMSDYEFKYKTFALYDFDGEVFWYLGRTGKAKPSRKRGTPEFITIFRKRDARPVCDQSSGEHTGWEFTIDGVPYFADRLDVVHFAHFDLLSTRTPFNPFKMQLIEPPRGRSTLDSKRLAISADIAAARYNYDFFSRGIAPNVAFITKDQLEIDEDAFRDKLRARLAGKNGEPLILSGDWAVQNISAAQKDAEFSQGRQIAREEQLAGRVPPIVMGKDDATFANAQAQLLTWWEVVLDPALTHFCATLDVNLLENEPDIWCDLSTDDVDALQAAKRERLKAATELATRRVPWDVAARTVGLEMEQFEGSEIAFGSYTDIPVTDILSGSSKAEIATVPPATAPSVPDATKDPANQPGADPATKPASDGQPAAETPRFIRVVRDLRAETRIAGPFDFQSTQVNFGGIVGAAILGMAARIPDEALAEKGRETDPHTTVKFGIAPEVTARDVTEAIANSDSVIEMVARGGGKLTFGKTAMFTAEEYDVVFVELDSKDLEILNAAISASLPVTDTHPNYVPHATLAYVQPGRGADFIGDETLAGTEVTFQSIAFSDVDGNQIEIPLDEAIAQRRARTFRVLDKESEHSTIAITRDATADRLQWIAEIIRGDDPDLQAIARKFHIRSVNMGAQQIGDLLKIEALIAIDNPKVTEFLATRANLITSVNKTTAGQVFDAVKAGITDGETPESIADLIRTIYKARKSDADLIARQENGSALSGGRFLQMDEAGTDATEWLCSRDNRVRESHAPGTGVDGEIVALGEQFSNGCRYPQDPDGPKDEVIGCRCVATPARLANERSMFSTEEQRAAYWRASVAVALRQSDKQFASTLSRYFNDQRGRVLAKLAKTLAA